MMEILRAPPFATVQDLGRPGHRAEGVPPAGAMDHRAVRRLNHALGNGAEAAVIEWALGPGQVRFERGAWVAAGPAGLTVDGAHVPPWQPAWTSPGQTVALEAPGRSRFSYLAVDGGVGVPIVLGSRSTYLPGRMGGWEGRRLRTGDRLPLGLELGKPPTPVPSPAEPTSPASIRVLPGPQAEFFSEEAWDLLCSGAFGISSASDRMGYRLEGPPLGHAGPAALPSEPVCPGAVQVPDGAAPIVLMPDGPTVGGYPKIAVVISADLGRLAQMLPGDRPRFVRVTQPQAVAALREQVAIAGGP